LEAHKIGEIRSEGFYIFQIPGTHDLMRPKINLKDGYRQEMETRQNELFYWGNEEKGLVIYLGEEPHQNEQQYVAAMLDAAEALGVRRIAVVAGVYGAMPYDKDREVSCVYSLPSMKSELEEYSVKLSDYSGGSTIGIVLADQAEERGIECVVFYALVPAYDFGEVSTQFTGIKIERDYKAWHDLMRRLNYMFGLQIDLSDLEQRSERLMDSMAEQIEELDQKMPQLDVKEYLQEIDQEFTERPFMPHSGMWERELGDLLDDLDE
jgi:predicted ATP-grasp superfamily ATP-dependent carboligase